MKHIFFLLAILFTFSKNAEAQPPRFDIDMPITVCSNVEITLYAVEHNTCNIVGITNPMTIVPNSRISLFAPYPGIWSLNPSSCGCTWDFIAADVKSVCVGSPSGTPFCPSWDSFTIGVPQCGYNEDDCFDYSVSCGSCSPGDMRHAHFDPHNMLID